MEKYKDTIKRIKPIAEQFVKNNEIEFPIKNSLTLLSNMGYYIIKSPASQNLSGFYMKKDVYPFIFVNSNHSLGRQNFSLWHEVYHHYMNHHNGISDFNSQSLEEREAEIFAGFILLPDIEIIKWSNSYDIRNPKVIAEMSVYYQMSFNAVVIRIMQLGEIDYVTFRGLKELSTVEKQQKLQNIYKEVELPITILEPTYDIQISKNIMEVLQNNYENKLTLASKINEIIHKIEVLNNDKY
ncbi:ImmA/IrrE family metallo-endopeptidase [Mammaliicoccus fleurettii]|uniref:ImmA/IrrE family metallo-endopeptidase n=1 Tax=Mammaliicoccus fleurettii TaxID=150056 RepID=UPI002DBE7818|nr:ImmA/IrrE family metallo-endopeptidase [Mammaliicoccus fleurettii]MEB7781277.1 ImmA/IrrE family metallo-endopeptidase [Mammaliicoccus fleurettii]MEB8067370.1 ImmA/IrrE family metallo-endopeptidase [Mammaliicoccus fleurettii]